MRAGATMLRQLGCLAASCGSLQLGATAQASAAIPASERAALIAIYDSTNGPGWTYRFNWRNAEDTDFAPPGTECTWYGVRCYADGTHVMQLELQSNQLIGPLPPEIGNLSSLWALRLGGNQLTQVPPEIGRLSSLNYLMLSASGLAVIPPEIGNLSSLILLDLSYNQLASFPPEIANLPNLNLLNLESNQLASLPSEIGNLSNLTDLFLASNELASVPPEIGKLASLGWLDVNSNQLTSIPPEIGNLPSLGYLNLNSNQLTSLPPEIGNLASLGVLYASYSKLTGSIPPQIGNLTGLESLDLHHNQLTGPIPREIGNLRFLGALDLSSNQLTGPIPPEIVHLGERGELWMLGLNNNELTGPIPPELGSLRMGDTKGSGTILLDHNQLSGPIPPEIGGIRCVRVLRLDHNELSGPMPPELGNLCMGTWYTRGTAELHLEDNHLSGAIPPELGNLTDLAALHLDGNQLRGAVPGTLGNLTNLREGESDLRWNALHTSDAALRAFLDSKQVGHDWEGTQTVAPTGLAAGDSTLDSVSWSWSPIRYTGDEGGYRIWYGTQPGGPYTLGGTTVDKTVSAFTLGNLDPGRTYCLTLDTVTEPHSNNPNAVASERSTEVSAMTGMVPPGWYALTVAAHGRGTVTSSPGAIACGAACHAAFWPRASVVLTATPEDGSVFLGWGGACAGTALTCDLTMDLAKTVTATFSTPLVSFYTVAPCRAFDSRSPAGSPALRAGTYAQLAIGGRCGIPATAKAVSLNVTVVSPSAGGHLRLYASGTPRPGTSSINYLPGQTRANNAVVSLGVDGAVVVYVSQPRGTAHVVLDVTGYFQ
jgi:Leucine-rich repeat (LRR) protein